MTNLVAMSFSANVLIAAGASPIMSAAPEEAGELAFPALQTYDDGEVVEWTGPPDADTPASIVEIGATPEDGGGPDGWTIAAFILGLAGTALGVLALVRGTR